VFAVGQHDAADCDITHFSYGLSDHRKGVVSYLPIGAEVVRPYQVARIDLAAVNEFVDLDGARGLQRDLFELLLGDLDELIVFELVPL
jgi:hypothetical protein